jgi:RNA polymerase sigma factor (TIGR02999 family)
MRSQQSVESAGAGAQSPRSARTLTPQVYDELKAIAGAYLRGRRAGTSLQPTLLVSEAYLKLAEGTRKAWGGEAHFKAVAAKAMRQIMIDHARARGAQKRGGGAHRVTISNIDSPDSASSQDIDVISLHAALERLAALDARKAAVVELRFFGGLSIVEAAEALGISHMTVSNDWTMARAWLARELENAS